MIRFILVHYVSKMDVNGNRYWLTRYTSTLTGRSLLVSTPHDSNSRAVLDMRWPEIFDAAEVTLPIREWDRMRKRATMVNTCMDDAVRVAVLELETEPEPE
jgi:hypothetical protein